MPSATSAFLDILRIVAAIVVFTDHCAEFWYPRFTRVTSHLAHSAVVVFFVLSGYVIAYTASTKERDLRPFAVSRLSRLYSVVLPALLLTFILQSVGQVINPQFYAQSSRPLDGGRYLFTALFLQSIWTFSATPPNNGPFWSLSYEFWYYALFGVLVLVRVGRLRYCLASILVLIVGPNILLLMPCWILGVVLFLKGGIFVSRISSPKLTFAIAIVVMLATISFLPPFPYRIGQVGFWFSSSFLSDWVTALTVGAAIIAFNALNLSPPEELLAACIRGCAGHTFSLYLYHFPLIAFATATVPFDQSNFWQVSAVVGCIILIVLFLSSITEGQRFRLKGAIDRVFDFGMKTVNRRHFDKLKGSLP